MTKWNPISTAPKDGTKIDLWVIDGKEKYRLSQCRWDFATDSKGNPLVDIHWDCWTCDRMIRPSRDAYPQPIPGKPSHWTLPEKGPSE